MPTGIDVVGPDLFDRRMADHYEAWYGTAEGRRADAQEKHLLGALIDGFPGAGTALEVGCGTGHFTRWLCDRGLATVGLDRSGPMLAQAQKYGGCPYVRADALRLPFVSGAFDLVAFITTLEFLEQPRGALAEAVRVAAQGLVLGVLTRWSALGLRRKLEGLFRPTVYRAAHFYGVAELKRVLRSVAGEAAAVQWQTTLFSCRWPRALARGRWGGFIGMALYVVKSEEEEDGERNSLG